MGNVRFYSARVPDNETSILIRGYKSGQGFQNNGGAASGNQGGGGEVSGARGGSGALGDGAGGGGASGHASVKLRNC